MKYFVVYVDKQKNFSLVKKVLESIKHISHVIEQDDKYEIPEEDLKEIKRRAKEMEENPELGLTWSEFQKSMKKKMLEVKKRK